MIKHKLDVPKVHMKLKENEAYKNRCGIIPIGDLMVENSVQVFHYYISHSGNFIHQSDIKIHHIIILFLKYTLHCLLTAEWLAKF